MQPTSSPRARPVPPAGANGPWQDPATGWWWDASAEHWHDPRTGQWTRWIDQPQPAAPPAWAAPPPSATPPSAPWPPPPAPAGGPPRNRALPVVAALGVVAIVLAAVGIYLLTSSGGRPSAAGTAAARTGPSSASRSGSPSASASAGSAGTGSGRQPGAWPVSDVPLPLPASKSELGGPVLVDPKHVNPDNPDYLASDLSRGQLSYGGLSTAIVQQYATKTVPSAGWKQSDHEKYASSQTWSFTKNDDTELLTITYFTDGGDCQIEFERPAQRRQGATGTAVPTAAAS